MFFAVVPKPLEATQASRYAWAEAQPVRAGLATATSERVCAGVRKVEVARIKIAMIIFAVAPASASKRPAALRKPCGLQSRGKPASEIASRIHPLKQSTVKGLP